MNHLVSIICPIYNEERFIVNCVESILNQDYSHESIEVFFVDGRSTDGTKSLLQPYLEQYPFIHLLDNPEKVVPYALNYGIKASKGDVIMRLDGHCVYPNNYISVLVNYLFELSADNVGALWNTLPANDSLMANAIAIGSSHKFGVGGSLHKVGITQATETDTVPFGCYRRDVFDRIGMFDTDLIRNQDDEFNARLINAGGKIVLIPEVVIDYTARDTISKMARMYYQYGLFKPLVNKKLGAPATIRQFFPLFFVLGLIFGGLVSVFLPILWYAYVSVLSVYLLLSLYFSFKITITQRRKMLLLVLPFVFFTIHVSYGWGYLCGIFKLIFKQRFAVHVNR